MKQSTKLNKLVLETQTRKHLYLPCKRSAGIFGYIMVFKEGQTALPLHKVLQDWCKTANTAFILPATALLNNFLGNWRMKWDPETARNIEPSFSEAFLHKLGTVITTTQKLF